MQCPRCGARVVLHAQYCPACGQRLSLVDAPKPVHDGWPQPYPEPLAPVDGPIVGPPPAGLPTPPQQASRTQSRWWWRILLIGVGLYLAVNTVFLRTENAYLLPQLLMIGTFLVPVTYIAFLYEDGTLYDVPLSQVALIFFFGGVVGSLAASLLEARFVSSSARGVWGQLTLFNAAVVAISEEAAKLIALIPFLLYARRRYPTVMHGLVLGAAAGMGFAAFESMGYAFGALIGSQNLDLMNQVIRVRALLAPLGHGTWTAIIGAALWHEQLTRRFALNTNVAIAFLLAVTLHVVWDWLRLPLAVAGLPIVHLMIGVMGLLLLRFFLLLAKGDQGAPFQQQNLATALRLYAGGMRAGMGTFLRRKQRP